MRNPQNAGKGGTNEDEHGIDEQIENTPEVRVIPPTPLLKTSNKSGSSSTITASRVNPPGPRGENMIIDEQIAEWMKGSKGRQGKVEGSEEEKLLQSDF